MQDPKLELVQRFFSGTGASYDFMVNFATLGIDRLWKRKIVDLIPADSSRVLDLACGTGISTFAIANRYPNCKVVGVELRDEYLALARAKAQKLDHRNVEFVLSRAEDYRSSEAFDCVTSSYLAKYADLKRLIPSIRDLLKKDGVLIMHDFTFPPKAYLVWIWRCYFWLLQRLGSRLCPAWREIYYGLPGLIEHSSWTAELPQVLWENQFRTIQLKYLTAYGSAIITARK